MTDTKTPEDASKQRYAFEQLHSGGLDNHDVIDLYNLLLHAEDEIGVNPVFDSASIRFTGNAEEDVDMAATELRSKLIVSVEEKLRDDKIFIARATSFDKIVGLAIVQAGNATRRDIFATDFGVKAINEVTGYVHYQERRQGVAAGLLGLIGSTVLDDLMRVHIPRRTRDQAVRAREVHIKINGLGLRGRWKNSKALGRPTIASPLVSGRNVASAVYYKALREGNSSIRVEE